MEYLIDTNICIHVIKKYPKKLVNKFKKLSIGDIGISSVTLAELEYGIAKSQHKTKNQQALTQFLIPLEVMAFNDLASSAYGEIRAQLETKGTIIGAMDLMIAAHALSLNSILVTNNTKEFSRVKGLEIENWI